MSSTNTKDLIEMNAQGNAARHKQNSSISLITYMVGARFRFRDTDTFAFWVISQ